MRLAGGPVDPSRTPARLVFYPTLSVRIVGIVGFAAIVLLSFGISAGMLLHRGGAWSLLFVLIALPSLYMLAQTFTARLWSDDQEVGVSSPLQHSRCPRGDLASMRIEPTRSRYGPACWFVRKDGTVAFKAQVNLWSLSQIAAMARYLGVPLITRTNTTGNVCPVCGFSRLSEPISSKGLPSHEVCPSCGFAFDDPAALNDDSYRGWRAQWIAGGMTWFGRAVGDPPPADCDPKGQLAALTGSS